MIYVPPAMKPPVQIPLPRKGTETSNSASKKRFMPFVQIPLPRKGTETRALTGRCL